MHFFRLPGLHSTRSPLSGPASASRAQPRPEQAAPAETRQGKNAGKILTHLQKLEQAQQKRSNIKATRDFIATRHATDEKRRELLAARTDTPGDKKRIAEIKREKDALKEQARELYIRGPLNLSEEEMAEKRWQQYVPAGMEGLHTAFGARIFSAATGIGGPDIPSAAGKIALSQGLGYTPQSLFSGLGRILTEGWQTRAGKGGKPVMAPNLAPGCNFRQGYKGLEAARDTLLSAQSDLSAALERSRLEPSETNTNELERCQQGVALAIAAMCEFEGVYEKLCISLQKECRGKKASAVVSVIAGMASGSAFAVEPTGVAAVAGHKLLCLTGLLLQMPMSAWDYMDGTIDYPLKVSADRIDIDSLIRKEARHKPHDQLEDGDFDSSVASRLYEEQPQGVRTTVLAIARYELSKLNGEKLQLMKEMRENDFSRLPMKWKSTASRQDHIDAKLARLAEIKRRYVELDTQYHLYEEHRGDQIDPDGVIGKAIADWRYFCRKSASAAVLGKVGEFYAQFNQRITNDHNPFLSLAMVSIAQSAAIGEMEPTLFKDALHAMQGTGPDNPAAEQAVIALSAAQGVAAVNSGVTVLPARFEKAKDRKALAAPGYIAQGKGVERTLAPVEQIELAEKTRMISSRGKKKLDKVVALTGRDASGVPAEVSHRKRQRAEKKWQAFEKKRDHINELVEKINDEWLIKSVDKDGRPLCDKEGKQRVQDLRASSVSMSMNMPLLERAWIPVKGVPRSIWQSATFWVDLIKAKRASDACRPLVDRGQVLDPALGALLDEVERELSRSPAQASNTGAETGDLPGMSAGVTPSIAPATVTTAGVEETPAAVAASTAAMEEVPATATINATVHEPACSTSDPASAGNRACDGIHATPFIAEQSPLPNQGRSTRVRIKPASGVQPQSMAKITTGASLSGPKDASNVSKASDSGEAFTMHLLADVVDLKCRWHDVERGLLDRTTGRLARIPAAQMADSSASRRYSDLDIEKNSVALTRILLAMDSQHLQGLDPASKMMAARELGQIRGSIQQVRHAALGKNMQAMRVGMARGRLEEASFNRFRVLQSTLSTLDRALQHLQQLERAVASLLSNTTSMRQEA